MLEQTTFERIRKEDPVCWTEEINGRGFWSITKHADILKINNKVANRQLQSWGFEKSNFFQ